MSPEALLLIGPLPDPRGGVSVHIERLGKLVGGFFRVAFVDESRRRKPGIFNLRSLDIFRYLALVREAKIVHIHSGRPLLRLLHVVAARALGKRTIVTVHGHAATGRTGALIDRIFLRWAHELIVVDGAIRARLRLKRPVLIRHGFIPPGLEDEPALPGDVREWIEDQRRRGRKIFIANAWRLDRYRGADLYGLDLCMELACKLREKGETAAFFFSVSSLTSRRRRYESFSARIAESGLGDSFLLRHGPLSFVRLIREADCVLRPTRADADSLTVREALFFAKPVIASDVTARPEGVELFRSGDADDLLAKVMALSGSGAAAAVPGHSGGDALDFYRNLYDGRVN